MFFTSDTHFGHANVLKYSRRPFASKEDMEFQLIMRWNRVVPPRGIVYHLGDFAFMKPKDASQLLTCLNGTIHLVPGNHDSKDLRKFLVRQHDSKKFVLEPQYMELRHEGRKIVMCHFPLESWNMMKHGSIHLHGHSHGNSRYVPNRFDVGVDVPYAEYAPIPIQKILGCAVASVPRPDREDDDSEDR